MPGMTVAELVARLRVDDSNFTRGMRNAESAIVSLERVASRSGGMMGGLMQSAQGMVNGIAGIAKGAASAVAMAGVAATGSLVAVGTQYNILLQQTKAAFTTLLGSAEKAQGFINEITTWNRESPFPRQVFIEAAQQMVAFGISAQKVVPIFKAVEDAIAASGRTAGDVFQITGVLSNIKSLGRATWEELQRLSLVGINAVEMMAQQTGTSVDAMRKKISDGLMGADETIELLRKGMEEKFGGAAANVKNTWIGAFDRVKGAWRDIGSHLMNPFIDGADGGGVLVTMANKIADALRTLEKSIFIPLKEAVAGFFDEFEEGIKKINVVDWINKGMALWREYGGTIKQFLPVIGALSVSFAAAGLSHLPFLGGLMSLLPIPGPLAAAFIALVASNEKLRDIFIGVAKTVASTLGPVLKELGVALAGAGAELAAVMATIGPGFITDLATSFARLLEVVTPLVPIFGRALSGAFMLLAAVLPPVIDGISVLVGWISSVLHALGPLGPAVALVALAFVDLPGPLGLVKSAVDALGPSIGQLWGYLMANPLVGLGIAIAYFAVTSNTSLGSIKETLGSIGDSFMWLPRVVGSALSAVLQTVNAFAQSINNALRSALDPFMRHSPSLVDQVIAGTELIAAKYAGLASDLIPTMRSMESAMDSLTNAAAGATLTFDAKQNAEVEKQIALFGGQGLLAAYQTMGTLIARIKDQMKPLVDRFNEENYALYTQQKALDELNKSYRDYRWEMKASERAVEDAQMVVEDYTRSINRAQDDINEMLSRPLQGSRGFADASFANGQAIAALQYRLNQLKMSDGPQDEIQALEQRINDLAMAGDQLDLQKQLTLGAQEYELQKLADTANEVSFAEAAKTIAEAATTIRDLNLKLDPATDNLQNLEDALRLQQREAIAWQRTIEDAAYAVEKQTDVVNELGEAIGGVQKVLDDYSAKMAEIAAKAAKNWSDMASGAGGAGAAAGAALSDLAALSDYVVPAFDPTEGLDLDTLASKFDDFSLDGFTSEIESAFGTIQQVVELGMTGLATFFGIRGVGGLLVTLGKFAGPAGAALVGVGTAISAWALPATVAIVAGIAMNTKAMGDSADRAKDIYDEWFSRQNVQTVEDYADAIRRIPQPEAPEMDSLFDKGLMGLGGLTGMGSDFARIAQNLNPFDDNSIADYNAEAGEAASRTSQLTSSMGGLNSAVYGIGESFDILGFQVSGNPLLNPATYEGTKAEMEALIGRMGLLGSSGTEIAASVKPVIEGLDLMGLSLADVKDVGIDALVSTAAKAVEFQRAMVEAFEKSSSVIAVTGSELGKTLPDMQAEFDRRITEAKTFKMNFQALVNEGPKNGMDQADLEELLGLSATDPAKAYELAQLYVNGLADGATEGLMARQDELQELQTSTLGLSQTSLGQIMTNAADNADKIASKGAEAAFAALTRPDRIALIKMANVTQAILANAGIPAVWAIKGKENADSIFTGAGKALTDPTRIAVLRVLGAALAASSNSGLANLWWGLGTNEGGSLVSGIEAELRKQENKNRLQYALEGLLPSAGSIAAAAQRAVDAASAAIAGLIGGATGGLVPGAAVGGLVPAYMAAGGVISKMTRRGSDTIPAMLTPGEFVMRKRAVDQIGAGTLAAMNAGKWADIEALTTMAPTAKEMHLGGGGSVGGGGDTVIQVTVSGNVMSERDLVNVIHDGLSRKTRNNGPLAFGKVSG